MRKERDESSSNPPAAFEGMEDWQLVDELLRRGWETSERVRNGRPRRLLLAPLKK